MNIQPGHYVRNRKASRLASVRRVTRVWPDGSLTVRYLATGHQRHFTRPDQLKIVGKRPMKLQLSLDDAKHQAEPIITALEPACHRIAVAGSIRRQCQYIGDVEIVAIPRMGEERDMFGYPVGTFSRLDVALDRLIAAGQIEPGDKQGPRYKKFVLPRFGLQLDLFIVNHDRWGVIYTQRTGSADFSHWLVTSRAQGGALPFGMRIKEGRLWQGGVLVPTPEERDVFEHIGIPWLAPPQRKAGQWKR